MDGGIPERKAYACHLQRFRLSRVHVQQVITHEVQHLERTDLWHPHAGSVDRIKMHGKSPGAER